MNVKQLVEREFADAQVLGGNLPQCHFLHHKSHMTRLGTEPELQRWKAGA
jgi:hypothetical protein